MPPPEPEPEPVWALVLDDESEAERDVKPVDLGHRDRKFDRPAPEPDDTPKPDPSRLAELNKWLFAWASWSVCATAILALFVGWRALLAAFVIVPGSVVVGVMTSGMQYTRKGCHGCGCHWTERGWELDPRYLPLYRFRRTKPQCCHCGRDR